MKWNLIAGHYTRLLEQSRSLQSGCVSGIELTALPEAIDFVVEGVDHAAEPGGGTRCRVERPPAKQEPNGKKARREASAYSFAYVSESGTA